MRGGAARAGNALPLSERGPAGEARLRRRGEFDAVYCDGQRRASRQFTVFFRPNGLARSRFGTSVKRALGGAVVRNRIRRRIREAIRLHRREIPAGWDIVIHPRRSTATTRFADLEAELVQLLRRALAT